MKLQEVINFIEVNVPIKLYANDFPSNSNADCGFVRIDGGHSPDLYVVGLKSPSIQVVIRQVDGSMAESIANDIWKLFHAKQHYMLGSSKVHYSSCDQSNPVYVGKDNNGRTIYSINVTCKVSG